MICSFSDGVGGLAVQTSFREERGLLNYLAHHNCAQPFLFQTQFVMAGLVPAIHRADAEAFAGNCLKPAQASRWHNDGWPGQARP
jgi:hypothetical protein